MTTAERNLKILAIVGLLGIELGYPAFSVQAQVPNIVPDNTLVGSEKSSLNPALIKAQPGFQIQGGAIRGPNLFHSFSQFNLDLPQQRVYFLNPDGIQSIIARITGSSASNIQGTLGVIAPNNTTLGTASLFLINPNGIIFGPGARLDMGGAFVATTANRLIFANGTEFSATNPQAPPLLMMNVAPGIQYGASSAPITTAAGALLKPNGDLTLVADRLELQGQLQPGGNLTLISNSSLQSRGALLTLTSNAGTLGSINLKSQGTILLDQTKINTTSTSLNQQGGLIQLEARQIQILNNSELKSIASGPNRGGDLVLQASEGVTLNQSLLAVEADQQGQAGNLRISTPTLIIDGSKVSATALENSTGRTGNVLVNANQINISGRYSGVEGTSGIFAGTLAAAPAGNIIIQPLPGAADLTITFQGQGDNPQITAAGGRGPGGDLQLLVPGTLTINGGIATVSSNVGTQPSGKIQIQAGTLNLNGASITAETRVGGAGGDIEIVGKTANLSNGATISTTTLGRGNAGSIRLTLSDRLTLTGNTTKIQAGTELGSTGNGGNIWIDPAVVLLQDRAQIAVNARGSGTGGEIQLYAGNLTLEGNSVIAAETANSDGGNIFLKVDNILLLRNQSLISATAGGFGNGGNITIKAGFVVAVPRENSDIRANALFGKGGNLQITSQGIFGLDYRTTVTPYSDISASSQFGLDGTVTLNTPNVDLNRGLVALPGDLVDATKQIAQGCRPSGGQQFIISGRGGLPPTPTEMLNPTIVWQDLQFYRADSTPTRGADSTSGASGTLLRQMPVSCHSISE